MIDLTDWHIRFLVGSQDLYGDSVLTQVDGNTRQIVDGLNASDHLLLPVRAIPVLRSADAITRAIQDANNDPTCVGVISWMHTFSPAKMWTSGLQALRRPLLHLHTQFSRDLPWEEIDMDFMNLNQSAHGDREFGYICTRIGLERKVVVGHHEDLEVHRRVDAWMRAAAAHRDLSTGTIARLGDNMRRVAVTDGDRNEAERRFGYKIDYYGVGDLVTRIENVSEEAIDALCTTYINMYTVASDLRPGGDRHDSVREAARIELGMRVLLEELGAIAVTDTFEDLHGLRQLPGIAAQRLMSDGFGFGAEGDWKTAGLVRAMKVMETGLGGGTSFMEDYTYHLDPDNELVLGAHMLEICPSISEDVPRLEVHPLSIGDREDPARLVFNAHSGEAVVASLIDMGDGMQLAVNEIEVVNPPAELPNLPVARAVWRPQPDLATSAECWIQAGGAHHTSMSYAVTTEMLRDYSVMAGIDVLSITADTDATAFVESLRARRRGRGIDR